MAAETSNSLMNFSMGYSTGNQFDIGKKENTVGWLGAISYNNQTEYYIEAIDNYFNTNTNPDVYAWILLELKEEK